MALCFLQVLCEPVVQYLAGSEQRIAPFWNIITWYPTRIDFGPGYRIYFGKDGDRLVILLAGGTKKRQDADIAAAKAHWRDYKHRKRQEVT
ncbi:type II toxin-antitoxin system RelE/ParE family toxin [Thiolapillus sp.]|uniref:type II toxin-antitoxin system RelE/ParE family toxin n=1 Tax=Thiolapillus sp. TaxID=2017437 RepID=UPI003AF8A576